LADFAFAMSSELGKLSNNHLHLTKQWISSNSHEFLLKPSNRWRHILVIIR